MNINRFPWHGWDPEVSYSAGIAAVVVGSSPKVLLIRQAEGTIRDQKDGTQYREQAWWKMMFGRQDPEDADPMDIALREGLEESGCYILRDQLVSVIYKRMRSKRPSPQTYHEDYFFLGLFEEELTRVQGIKDKRICGVKYFPLDSLPATGKEQEALGVQIARKHLWAIYSLCMEYVSLVPYVHHYGNRLAA